MSLPKEIGGDAEQAFAELWSCWEEGNRSSEEKCKIVNEIRQELLNFWKEKVSAAKLHALKYKVKMLRDKIEVCWEMCFLSEDEKQQFKDYKSKNYTPELHDLHVEELTRLKRKFHNNEALFLLIKKHQDKWKCLVNMDNQLYNRDRSFQNRGAQLLHEERDRRAAQKDLPRLEEEINKETEMYEQEHGIPFLIYGKCFSDIISQQKEEHKENQKLLKSARKMRENCAATSDVPKTTNSVSKLKRTHVSNTQSPSATQSKQARITSCDKLASSSADVRRLKRGLPVRRKLIERKINVPVQQP